MSTTDLNTQLHAALESTPHDSYDVDTDRQGHYRPTGDGGMVVVVPLAEPCGTDGNYAGNYVVSYAPERTLDDALGWLGTAEDAESGAKFYDTAAAAAAAFAAKHAAHA